MQHNPFSQRSVPHDITSTTIIRTILAGERNPLKLAALSDPRVHASREEIAKSLEGNWRPELLFVLQQEVELWWSVG